jgi:hypothetical protein
VGGGENDRTYQVIPPDLATEAAVYREALLGGIVEPAEVVAWADAWILCLDEIPEALVEVSYSQQRLNALLTGLNRLSSDTWDLAGIRLYFQMLERYLRADSSRLRTVTKTLFRLNLNNELPKTVSAEIYMLDDRLDLALDGIYESLEQVYQDVLQALMKWAAPA